MESHRGLLICSETVSGRRPFGKDSEMDYTVDSGDEWEVGEAKGCPEEPQTLSVLSRRPRYTCLGRRSVAVIHGRGGDGRDERGIVWDGKILSGPVFAASEIML